MNCNVVYIYLGKRGGDDRTGLYAAANYFLRGSVELTQVVFIQGNTKNSTWYLTHKKSTYLVEAEVASLVSVGVVPEVEVVDVRSQDVSPHVHLVEQLRVGQVFAEPANLVGDPVALRVVPPQV